MWGMRTVFVSTLFRKSGIFYFLEQAQRMHDVCVEFREIIQIDKHHKNMSLPESSSSAATVPAVTAAAAAAPEMESQAPAACVYL